MVCWLIIHFTFSTMAELGRCSAWFAMASPPLQELTPNSCKTFGKLTSPSRCTTPQLPLDWAGPHRSQLPHQITDQLHRHPLRSLRRCPKPSSLSSRNVTPLASARPSAPASTTHVSNANAWMAVRSFTRSTSSGTRPRAVSALCATAAQKASPPSPKTHQDSQFYCVGT